VTIVAVQRMLGIAMKAAHDLEKEGISCEIIDPRTLVPLDIDTIATSVKKTGRLITVEEAVHAGGWGAEVVSQIADETIWYLESPIVRVTLKTGLIPFSGPLEEYITPSKDDVIAAVRRVMEP
jgi:pyruvate dehydrogenase E1 component beta subunit